MRQRLAGPLGPILVGTLAVLASVLAASEARAITGTPAVGKAGPGVIVKTANSAQFVYGGNPAPDITRAYSALSGGGVAARDLVPARVIPGQPAVIVARSMAPRALAVAGALAVRSLPTVAVGVALWDIYNNIRVMPDGAGGLLKDDGVLPGTTTIPGSACYNDSSLTPPFDCKASPASAAAYALVSSGRSNYCELVPASPLVNFAQYFNFGILSDGQCILKGQEIYVTGYETSGVDVPECPASIDPFDPKYSIPKGFPVMPDGKCRQARGYAQPISAEGAADWAVNFPSFQTTPEMARDIIDRGQPVEATGPVEVSGPISSPGNPQTTTTEGPSGTTTVTTNTVNNYTYQGDTVTWNITEITSTNTGGQTTTTTTDGKEITVCGLPGKPACKLDETGTPDPTLSDPAKDVQGAMTDIVKIVQNPTSVFPSFPSINWAFALPTGCGVIPLPAFAPFLTGIDICQFQPMFHEIMGLVWMLGGLFGAISLFWRDNLAT